MKARWSHGRGAVVVMAALSLAVVGCNRPGGGIRTTTTRDGGTTTTMMDHGGEHGMPMGGQYNHAPTQEQLTQLHRLVDQTRTYAKAHWPTLTQVLGDTRLHFVGIGDGVHYTSKTCREDKTSGPPKPHIDATHFGPGYDTFDWTCPESLVMRRGTVAAVMYQLPDNMGMNDIPDMGGNYTMWHNHPLCFRSNNPDQDDYYRIGGALIGGTCSGGYYRGVSPMIHVWVVPNDCGPFAGTVRNEGSCISDSGW
jgi:hypothetical protein